MLAEHDHERFVQHAALLEVGNQARVAAIEAGHQFLPHARVVFPVRVPAGARKAELVPEHRDEFRAGFDEPPGREATLAEEHVPVVLANLARFPPHVQGVL